MQYFSRFLRFLAGFALFVFSFVLQSGSADAAYLVAPTMIVNQ
ncbi:MAG TPA: hypothetical protein PK765_02945 [bacterium]|nr:hypothetical protein [bacterium]